MPPRLMKFTTSPIACVLLAASVVLGPSSAIGQPCDEPYLAPWALTAGDKPTSVVVGDIDGDGDPDVVVANESSHDLTISTNLGGGLFEVRSIEFVFGTAPRSLVGADFDGDGDLDLAFGQVFTREVFVLRNDGAGGFDDVLVQSSGVTPNALAVVDYDGDGDSDLSVTASGIVRLLANNGDATFDVGASLVPIPFAMRAGWGDADGDGDMDAIVTSFDLSNPALRLFLNDGAGGFDPPVEYDVDSITAAAAFGDLDGDGDQDIVYTMLGAIGRVCTRMNEAGVYVGEECYEAGARPDSLALADFDLDGDLDVAVANFDGFEVSTYRNRGDGSLEPQVQTFVGEEPQQVLATDINQDGAADLAVANGRADDAAILVNDGAGGFGGAGRIDTGEPLRDAVATDVDGDGDDDFVASLPRLSAVGVFHQDEGVFSLAQTIAVGGEPWWIEVADLDLDGDPDAAVLTDRGEFVEGLINDGPGQWRSAGRFEIDGGLSGFVLADADGDGDPDALSLANFDRVLVAYNDGRGVFFDRLSLRLGDNIGSLAVGDLDGDSQLDIAFSRRSDGVAVVYELVNRQLTAQRRYTIGRNGDVLLLADTNADGHADLIANDTNEAGIAVWLGDGRGGLGPRVFSKTGQVTSEAFLLDATGDGAVDLVTRTTQGVQTLPGDNTGGFRFGPVLTIAQVESGFVAGDLNGDGRLDIGLGDLREPALHVLYNRCVASCRPDLDGDGELTIFDFLAFQNAFNDMDPAADFDGDGEFTIFDFLAFQNAFDAGCQ